MATPLRLHLRFAAATAAVIALAGAALLLWARHQSIVEAEQNVTAHARYVEQAILRDELARSDLARPVSGARLRHLDWLFDARVLVGGGLRVKLYRAPDGLVTYSNDHSLIGGRADDPAELRDVLAGAVHRDIAFVNHEGGDGRNVKALEVYVPLTLRGSSRPEGVFELYQSYAPVAAAVHSFLVPFALLLLAALVALWVALFPLVQRMVRAVERSRSARDAVEVQLRETSEQLRQSQKMEAIGRLAGGVAHDFNNLLVAINGYADSLAGSVEDETQRRYAREIASAGRRARALTQQLLAFSRRQVLVPQVLSLNDAVVEIESMLRRLIGEGVGVVLDLDPQLRPVEADPNQMGQVLLNLAVNARDAMSGHGTLTLTTRNDGDSVVLEVSDTGSGMDEETRAKIFEPFFTTKGAGEGTGLGLSTVYGIVTQSGGGISVRSAPGRGATFVVRLPAASRPAADAAPADIEPARGAGRVLVVDDDPAVRDVVVRMLRDDGYDVTAADSAHAALALGGSWDLLVADVGLPGTDGVELSRELDVRRVLFVSGYGREAVVRDEAAFLEKPFSRDELARAVRELLGSGLATSAA